MLVRLPSILTKCPTSRSLLLNQLSEWKWKANVGRVVRNFHVGECLPLSEIFALIWQHSNPMTNMHWGGFCDYSLCSYSPQPHILRQETWGFRLTNAPSPLPPGAGQRATPALVLSLTPVQNTALHDWQHPARIEPFHPSFLRMDRAESLSLGKSPTCCRICSPALI